MALKLGQEVFYKATEAQQIGGMALYSAAKVLLVDPNGVDYIARVDDAQSNSMWWDWLTEGTDPGQLRASLPT